MNWTDPEVPELDIRVVPPQGRNAHIFGAFDALRVGEGFVIINDYDPKALWHHFNRTRKPSFGWEYLERGPLVWRIGISKHADAVPVMPVRHLERKRRPGDADRTSHFHQG